jgi:hypothetical protein
VGDSSNGTHAGRLSTALLAGYAIAAIALAAGSYILLRPFGENGSFRLDYGLTALQVVPPLLWFAMVLASRNRGLPSLRAILSIGGLASLAAVVAYPFQSMDAIYYTASAAMSSRYGLSPFNVSIGEALTAHPHDQLLKLLFYYDYGTTKFPYGYLFLGYLQTLWNMTLGSPAAVLYLHKAVMLGVAVVCGVLAWQLDRALRRGGSKPLELRWWLLLVTLNPLVLQDGVANGHNDLVLLLLVLLMFLLLFQKRAGWALVVFVIALQWKVTVGLLGPFLLIWAWREGVRPRWKIAAYAVGIAASFLPYWLLLGVRGVPWLTLAGTNSNQGSLLRQIVLALAPVSSSAVTVLASGLSWASTFLWWPTVVLLALLYAWKGRPGVSSLIGWCACIYLLFLGVFVAYFKPWYLLWLLPFAPLAAWDPDDPVSWRRGGLVLYAFGGVYVLELLLRLEGLL